MDRDGNVAALLRNQTSSLDRVELISAGRRTILSPPSTALLGASFFAAQLDASGRRAFPQARLVSVALASGRPIVTIANPVAGAYSGVEAASFMWERERWHRILPLATTDRNNYWIVAGSSSALIFGVDDLAEQPSYIAAHSNGYPEAVGTAILRDGRMEKMLRGPIPTGGQDGMFWGYRLSAADGGSTRPHAVVWRAGVLHDLYQGVAWGANTNSVIVGDDRISLNAYGHPMIYANAHAQMISRAQGTAYDVSGGGFVVGSIARDAGSNAAFVFDLHATPPTLTLIDQLLSGRQVHVSDAYFVASDGSILGLATKGRNVSVVLLRPLRKSTRNCGK